MTSGGLRELTEAASDEALRLGLDDEARRLAPAAIAAVCDRGTVRAVAVHGHPHGTGGPTARDTVFRIASMSKSFLAATVLVLRDRGLLDLQTPIAALVPGVRLLHAGHEVAATGEQLLSNRSGLGEDNAWVDRHLGDTREELGALFAAGVPLAAVPGTVYQYSNLGQSLLGRAVEAVTGSPVEEVVREVLLEPLGLRRTAHSPDAFPDAERAHGFRTFDGGETFHPEPFVGAGALGCIGSMVSTVDDIATWMWFLGSAFTDEPLAPEVLSPASRRELQQSRTPIPGPPGAFPGHDLAAAGYGYGLVVEEDRRFGRVVQHSGGLPGFSSHMRWHTATGLGVVAFGNSDDFAARRVAGVALHRVLADTQAPSAVVRPWRETVRAAQDIDAAIRAGRPSAAYPHLADHVLADVPAAVRDARLAAQLHEIGGLMSEQASFAERVVTAGSEADLRWLLAGVRADLRVEVRLIGLPEPRVQGLSITVVPAGASRAEGEQPGPGDHHRVVLPTV